MLVPGSGNRSRHQGVYGTWTPQSRAAKSTSYRLNVGLEGTPCGVVTSKADGCWEQNPHMFRLPVSIVFNCYNRKAKNSFKDRCMVFSHNKQIQWVCKAAVMSFRMDR